MHSSAVSGEAPGHGGASGEAIYVAVRLRPLNEVELYRNRDAAVWTVAPNGQSVKYGAAVGRAAPPVPAGAHTSYTFDRVFGQDARNEEVYEAAAAPLVRSALAGVNCTLFAYGQTGGGKTHTMKAVMEMASSHVFELISATPGREFLLRLSALEIYNEVVRDLLAEDTPTLRLLDDPARGTVVDGAREEAVRSPRHLRHLLSLLEPRRQVGDNGVNSASSRSHLVVRLTIESRAPEGSDLGGDVSDAALATAHGTCAPGGGALVASLFFVDLAGSERTSKTGAQGVRLKEGGHINRSLLTLGTVIRKLAAGGTGAHVPYRDSKLTRILAHALGGSGRSAVVCCVSPAAGAVEATRATLLFADSARRVTNYARVNETVDDKVLLRQYQAEIARLRAQVAQSHAATAAEARARRHSDDDDDGDSTSSSAAALEEALAARAVLEKRLRGLELFILSSKRPHAAQWAGGQQGGAAPGTHMRGRTLERGSWGASPEGQPRPRSWSPVATPRHRDALSPVSPKTRTVHRAAGGEPGGAGEASARRVLVFDAGDDDDSETDGSDLQMNLAVKPVSASAPQSGPLADDIHALEGVGGLRGEEAGRALAAEMRVLRIHTVVGNLTSSLEEDEIMARLQAELEARLTAERSTAGPGAAPGADDDTMAALTAEMTRLQARVDAARAADSALAALNERLAASQADLDRYAAALAEANARAEAAERAAAAVAAAAAAQSAVKVSPPARELGLRESDENLPPGALFAVDAASPPRLQRNGSGALQPAGQQSADRGAASPVAGEWVGPRVGGLIDAWKNRETPPPVQSGKTTPHGAMSSPAPQPGGAVTQPASSPTGAWVPRSALDGERERRLADMRRLQECVAGAAAEGAALKGHLMSLRDELQRAEFQKKRLIAQVLKLEHAAEASTAQCAALSKAATNERRRRRREQSRRAEAQEEARQALRRCDTVAAAAAAAGALNQDCDGGAMALAGQLLDSWAGPPTAAWFLPKILRLWTVLHIPLLHRSQFYLGFRGRETFYWDAEHRRLAWLHASLKAARSDPKQLARHPLAGAAQALARERDELARRLRSLSEGERLHLYADFGVDGSGKARKKALAAKLWADAADVTLRGASSELVLRLHNQEPGQDLSIVFSPRWG